MAKGRKPRKSSKSAQPAKRDRVFNQEQREFLAAPDQFSAWEGDDFKAKTRDEAVIDIADDFLERFPFFEVPECWKIGDQWNDKTRAKLAKAIKNWYYRNRSELLESGVGSVTSGYSKRGMIPLFSHDRRRLPHPHQAWMKLYPNDVQPKVREALQHHLKNHPEFSMSHDWLAYLDAEAKKLYSDVTDDDVKAEVEFYRQNGHACGTPKPSVYPFTPEGHWEHIAKLPKTVVALLAQLKKFTGFDFTLMMGGLVPDVNQARVMSFYHSTDPTWLAKLGPLHVESNMTRPFKEHLTAKHQDQIKTFVLSNSMVEPSEYAKLEKASEAGDLTGVTIDCLPVPDALKYTMPEGDEEIDANDSDSDESDEESPQKTQGERTVREVTQDGKTPGSEQTLTKPAAGSKHDGSSANCGSPSEPASAQPNTSKSSTLHKLSIHEEMAKRDRNIAENRELMASMFGDIIPSLPSKTASRPKSKPRPKKVNAPVEPPLKTRPKPATSTYANVNLSQATLNGDPDPHLPSNESPIPLLTGSTSTPQSAPEVTQALHTGLSPAINPSPLSMIPLSSAGINQPAPVPTSAGEDSSLTVASAAIQIPPPNLLDVSMSPSVTSATLSPGTNVPTSGDVDIPATTSMLPAPRQELTGVTDSTPPLENADTPGGDGKKRKRVVETSLADLPLSLTSPQAALRLWNLRSQDPAEEELLGSASLTGYLGESFKILRTASFPPALQASWISLMVGFLRIEETRGFPEFKGGKVRSDVGIIKVWADNNRKLPFQVKGKTRLSTFQSQWSRWMPLNGRYPLYDGNELFAGGGSDLFDALVFLSWWSLAVLSTKQGQESAMQGLAAAIGDIEGLLRKVVLPPFNVDHYEGGNTKRMRKN